MNLKTPSIHILGGKINLIHFSDILKTIIFHRTENIFLQILTVNTLMLLESEKDPILQKIFFSKNTLSIPESTGIFIYCLIKKQKKIQKTPGIDLMNRLCEHANKNQWSIYLLGAKPGVAEQTQNKLQLRFPNLIISGLNHGYFNNEEELKILNEIQTKKPHLLFVALQMPDQEKWIYKNSNYFKGICAMGIGGSFDVISGNLKRAPLLIQKLGMEWLYRLIQEPWRWKRILKLTLLFFK